MYEELIKLLRFEVECNKRIYPQGPSSTDVLLAAAADAIEALEEEVKRWKGEAKDWYLAYMDLLPASQVEEGKNKWESLY